ncbi:hypothetical protein KSS87_009372 [Heliosperma pusillum]|nr:hypothetical protein KSS87_009372 [Heliosperma pusillum]
MAPSSSKHKQKDKILALSKENCLVEITVPKGPINIKVRHEYRTKPGCSFSPPFNNRFVFIVGGRSLDVSYYDLTDGSLIPGPPLSFVTMSPRLLFLGSKLFAFSYFCKVVSPICQVLDTATASDSWQWCPLETSPELPYPTHDSIASYFIVSYATYSTTFFLSFGNQKISYAICYDDYKKKWSRRSETPLPFSGQGKFVGSVCYGFPRLKGGIDITSHLAVYNLSIDWTTDSKVYCVELCRYSLLSNSPYPTPSYLHSFLVNEQNVFTILRTKVAATTNYVKQFSFEVDVVQLLPPQHERNSQLGDSGSVPPSLPFSHPEGSSRVLKHKSIPLPHGLRSIDRFSLLLYTSYMLILYSI